MSGKSETGRQKTLSKTSVKTLKAWDRITVRRKTVFFMTLDFPNFYISQPCSNIYWSATRKL